METFREENNTLNSIVRGNRIKPKMDRRELEKYTNYRMGKFFDHYIRAQDKYEAIWKLYDTYMPECITNCKQKKSAFSDDVSLDGPQGIYWIGENPKVLFVGREHYGWYGESEWPRDMWPICMAPLEFAYFTVPSMGSYWGIIKGLIKEGLKLELNDWDSIFASIAITNACKCLSNNSTLQWNLHQQCSEAGYLEKEISIVNAPLNVMFTKSHNMTEGLFQGKLNQLSRDDDFTVSRINHQFLIECAHPGRQSKDWRNNLVSIMKECIEENSRLY